MVLPGLIDCHAHMIGEMETGLGYASLVMRTVCPCPAPRASIDSTGSPSGERPSVLWFGMAAALVVAKVERHIPAPAAAARRDAAGSRAGCSSSAA